MQADRIGARIGEFQLPVISLGYVSLLWLVVRDAEVVFPVKQTVCRTYNVYGVGMIRRGAGVGRERLRGAVVHYAAGGASIGHHFEVKCPSAVVPEIEIR